MGLVISSKKSNTVNEQKKKTGVDTVSNEQKDKSVIEERLRVLEETVNKLVSDNKDGEAETRSTELETRLGKVEIELNLLKMNPASLRSSPIQTPIKFDSVYSNRPLPADSEDSHDHLLSIPDPGPVEHVPSSPSDSIVSQGSGRPRRKHLAHTMSEIEAYGKGLNPHDQDARREYISPSSNSTIVP